MFIGLQGEVSAHAHIASLQIFSNPEFVKSVQDIFSRKIICYWALLKKSGYPVSRFYISQIFGKMSTGTYQSGRCIPILSCLTPAIIKWLRLISDENT